MTPEQIAADVAARYGLPVAPDAVKFIPQGKMASNREYRWDGHQLKDVTGTTAKDSMRAAINARWRQHEHGKRLARAKKAEQPPKVHPNVEYSQRRQAEARAMAAAGATYDDIATRWGVTQPFVRKFCNKHKITVKKKVGGRQATAPDRLARVLAFAGDGTRYLGEIAEFMGVTKKAASQYLRDKGIPYKTMLREAA